MHGTNAVSIMSRTLTTIRAHSMLVHWILVSTTLLEIRVLAYFPRQWWYLFGNRQSEWSFAVGISLEQIVEVVLVFEGIEDCRNAVNRLALAQLFQDDAHRVPFCAAETWNFERVWNESQLYDKILILWKTHGSIQLFLMRSEISINSSTDVFSDSIIFTSPLRISRRWFLKMFDSTRKLLQNQSTRKSFGNGMKINTK